MEITQEKQAATRKEASTHSKASYSISVETTKSKPHVAMTKYSDIGPGILSKSKFKN